MWLDDLPIVDSNRFGSLAPVEVLYDFDGPRIFTAFDVYGGTLLCYEAEESSTSRTVTHLVVPTDARALRYLTEGIITVYDALDQPWLWVLESSFDGQVIRALKADGLQSIPNKQKPSKDATLWAHLMPLFSYRLIGDGLERGAVPASVVAAAVRKPTAAIKRLLELTAERRGKGRPDEEFRSRYDLLAQRMAFNSFEVSFQAQRSDQQPLLEESETYSQSSKALGEALSWLRHSSVTDNLDAALLDVLLDLAPPIHGVVSETEIKGRLLGPAPFRLGRGDTKKVRVAIAALRKPDDLKLLVGRIGEVDRDRQTFILREVQDGSGDTTCSFEYEHFDAVFDALENGHLMTVLGQNVGGAKTLTVAVVERKSEVPPRLLP